MIILIQGPPCSGKTTLGNSLSEYYSVPHLSKDELKESLFDSLGKVDSNWSRKLAVSANDLLFLVIRKHFSNKMSVIIETNITTALDREKLDLSLEESSQELIEIFLYAPKEILLDRFSKRWHSGIRHSGHMDDQRSKDVEKYIDSKISRPTNRAIKFVKVNTGTMDTASVLNIVLAELNSTNLNRFIFG